MQERRTTSSSPPPNALNEPRLVPRQDDCTDNLCDKVTKKDGDALEGGSNSR